MLDQGAHMGTFFSDSDNHEIVFQKVIYSIHCFFGSHMIELQNSIGNCSFHYFFILNRHQIELFFFLARCIQMNISEIRAIKYLLLVK